MNVSFTENAWEDYLYWQKIDKRVVKRINELIKAIGRSPFDGIGKPEELVEHARITVSRMLQEALMNVLNVKR